MIREIMELEGANPYGKRIEFFENDNKLEMKINSNLTFFEKSK